MQVGKRLKINAGVSVAMALIVLLVSIAALDRISKANTAAVIAGDINANLLERVTLRNDYIRNSNARAKQQWFLKHEQATQRVKSAVGAFQDPGDKAAIDALIKNNESIGKIFSAIVANRGKRVAASAGLTQEVEDRLLSQLNMRVYEAAVLSRKLIESSRRSRIAAIRLAGASFIVLVLAVIAAAIANSLTMSRAIADRVRKLRDGVMTIGEGNLWHRIDISGDDEFADLAKAFNEMTEKLHGSYATLEKEVVERTQAEQALRQSEERLQFSLETSHIGAWDLDLVDHSAFRSVEHDRIFGYACLLPKWTFEMFLERVLPEDRQMVQARFQEAVDTQGDWSFECRIRRADGEIRWIWAAGRHRVDETGKARRMAGIVQDITERKKADELRQSSAYHRSLLEASLDPLVTIDAKGKITDVNAATEKVTGQKREDLVGTDFSDYFTEPEKSRAGYQQVFENGFVTDYPLTIRHQDGRLTDVLYNASVYRDEGGKVLGVFAAARDITERKKTQDALRESEEHYHMLFDTIDEGFCLVEVMFDEKDKPVDYRFLEINPSFEKQTGLIDARGKTMRQLAPQHEEHWFQIYGQVALSGEPIRFQNRANQLHRWYDVYAFRFGLPEKRQVAILFNDITEKKKTEEALRSAGAYNRSLLEASLDPLVTIDAHGKITDVNAATEKVTGNSREDLIGADFSDFFTEPGKARAGYQQVFREGSVMDYALEIKRKDGHITPVLYNAAVYRDESGEVIGVFAAARDITERKKAEDIARLDETRNKSILKISQFPAASLRELLDFALDEAITFSNSKFGYLYFYHEDTQDFILHAWSKDVMAQCTIANPQTDYKLEKTGIWGEVVRQRKPIVVNDFAAPHPLKKGYPEGHAPLLRFFSVPVFSDGRIVAVAGFANRPAEYTDRDVNQMTLLMDSVWKIVERKNAEEQIQKLNQELEARVVERTAQLENTNRELEAFAYSVSHDLRSPLRSIEGFSLALLEDYVNKLDDTAKSYLSRVRNATVRMGHLIDDLLKLSRVTRSEMKRERVDLSVIGKDIAGRLAQSNPERSAEFIIADGLAADGDARLLTVALENLISNAWKFSEKAPRSVIEFGTALRDGASVFYVKDNGVGFDMSYADKLFNPFQRLHKIEEFPGTGIGLATVKRIINRHGGQVWIESEVDKGTTVYFTL